MLLFRLSKIDLNKLNKLIFLIGYFLQKNKSPNVIDNKIIKKIKVIKNSEKIIQVLTFIQIEILQNKLTSVNLAAKLSQIL